MRNVEIRSALGPVFATQTIRERTQARGGEARDIVACPTIRVVDAEAQALLHHALEPCGDTIERGEAGGLEHVCGIELGEAPVGARQCRHDAPDLLQRAVERTSVLISTSGRCREIQVATTRDVIGVTIHAAERATPRAEPPRDAELHALCARALEVGAEHRERLAHHRRDCRGRREWPGRHIADAQAHIGRAIQRECFGDIATIRKIVVDAAAPFDHPFALAAELPADPDARRDTRLRLGGGAVTKPRGRGPRGIGFDSIEREARVVEARAECDDKSIGEPPRILNQARGLDHPELSGERRGLGAAEDTILQQHVSGVVRAEGEEAIAIAEIAEIVLLERGGVAGLEAMRTEIEMQEAGGA